MQPVQAIRSIVLAACLVIVAAIPGTVLAQNSTTGKCSPVIVTSDVKELRVDCSDGHADLVAVTERINKLIADAALTRDQVRQLADLLNAFADARVGKNRLSSVMSVWAAAALATSRQLTSENANVYFI